MTKLVKKFYKVKEPRKYDKIVGESKRIDITVSESEFDMFIKLRDSLNITSRQFMLKAIELMSEEINNFK
jgi:hypothetical protein